MVEAEVKMAASIEPQRKFLPGIADLVDRLTITQMKSIFIPEHTAAYNEEMALIEHDIDLILGKDSKINAAAIRAIIVIMLSNRFIWENESKARQDADGDDPVELKYERLMATHSINGVRAEAKNKLSALLGGRKDYKIDCFASALVGKLGNWNVFSA